MPKKGSFALKMLKILYLNDREMTSREIAEKIPGLRQRDVGHLLRFVIARELVKKRGDARRGTLKHFSISPIKPKKDEVKRILEYYGEAS